MRWKSRIIPRKLDNSATTSLSSLHTPIRGDEMPLPEKTSETKPLKIVLAGASGMVGGELKASLISAGHEVKTLVRREADTQRGEIYWDPDKREIDKPLIEGMD